MRYFEKQSLGYDPESAFTENKNKFKNLMSSRTGHIGARAGLGVAGGTVGLLAGKAIDSEGSTGALAGTVVGGLAASYGPSDKTLSKLVEKGKSLLGKFRKV